jgi:hypothetical protein
VAEEGISADKYTGPGWISKIIKHIWRALLAHWTTRNKALHGETPAENELTKCARLHPLIRRLYARKDKL